MEKPSLEIGNSNWAIKEGELLGYNRAGNDYLPIPITMTRASLGTRVNPEGLVEDVELLGGELITCGDFSCATPSTYWTEVGNSSLVVGDYQGRTSVANINISGTANSDRIIQDFDYVSGVTYFISVDVYLVSGNFRVDTSNSFVPYDFVNTSTTGSWQTLTANFTATSTGTYQIWLRSSQQIAQFYVSNVSVKEVTKNNLARVDYTDGTSSLLVEPLRTNELTQSNQFDTTWNQSGTLTSGQDGVGGSTDAWKFENPGATSGLHQSDTTSGVQTLSAYFKKNSNYGVRLYAFGSVNCWAYFDLNNGAVVSTGNSTAKIETAGADWFRCSITFDQTNTLCYFYVTNNASTQVLGDFTIQYAQLEVGSYATSYIPTSGGTVTRVQDQYSKTGISNLIGSEGVLFVEMAALANDGTNRGISLNDGTATNRLLLYFSYASNQIAVISTGFTGSIIYTLPDETLFNKIAVRYKANDITLWVDGESRGTPVTSATIPTFTALKFDSGSGASPFYGKVKQLQVFKTALTDDELTILTGTSGVHFFPSYGSMAEALTYTIE